MGQLLQGLVAVAFLLGGLVLLWYLAHSTLAEVAALIREAWRDEWYGKERVARCNRGGTVISFTAALLVFGMQEVASLFGPANQHSALAAWLFVFAVCFLTVSLLTLADLEKHRAAMRGEAAPRRGRRTRARRGAARGE